MKKEYKPFNRRDFLGSIPAMAAFGSIFPLMGLENKGHNQINLTSQTPCFEGVPHYGVIVSTHPERGHYKTADFQSDVETVQRAYDDMMTSPDLPKTLIFDSSKRPFEFDGYLDIWQSKCRITATGGTTIIPAGDYTGTLIQSGLREDTVTGEDKLISNIILDNIWINGKNQCLGFKLRHIQMSTIHSLHVRSTDGPGLWLSDCCIENLFSNIVLSDNCGNDKYPALLIEPEYTAHTQELNVGNETINSTQFSGIMIHFPTNDALRVSSGQVPINRSRRQRKIQFSGCFFHGHGRQNKPLITLAEAYELSFVGIQILIWRDKGTIIQMGEKDARHPAGITMISHCIFVGKPHSDTTGIEVVNVETGTPCLSLFGNSFGSAEGRLAHAVDWGDQEGKLASWGSNAVNTNKKAHVGNLPGDAMSALLMKTKKNVFDCLGRKRNNSG